MGINAQTLINLMSYPNEISESEVFELVSSLENYPYFQLGRSLYAKALHDKQAPDAYAALSKAAIYAPNRSLLKSLFYEDLHIERTGSFVQTDEPIIDNTPSYETEEDSTTEVDTTPTDFDTNNSYNTPPLEHDSPSAPADEEEVIQSDEVYNELEENLRKLRESKSRFSEEEETEKKKVVDSSEEPSSENVSANPSTPKDDQVNSILLEELKKHDDNYSSSDDNQQHQNELIDKFINSSDNISFKIKPSVSNEGEDVEDLSSKSTAVDDSIVSENLAKIYTKQGKTEKAIEIYQKLIWKFPQKKAYFAEIIDSLKAE